MSTTTLTKAGKLDRDRSARSSVAARGRADGVLLASGSGPGEGTAVDLLVGPGRVGLHPVMSSAQGGQVVGARLAGWASVVGRDVLLDVVEVAAAGVSS